MHTSLAPRCGHYTLASRRICGAENRQKRQSGILLLTSAPQRFPMDKTEIDIDPCDHITSDAIGQPGQRVFYIQAYQAEKTYTVIIEKTQLQSLAVGIEQFLAEVARQNPKLEEAGADYVEEHMRINPPVDPVFRVGEIGLGYDQTRDRVVLFVREAQGESRGETQDQGEDPEPESGSVIRFWCTRTQLRQLARWGAEIASRGRPMCPQCGQPMEPEGHFCPKKNGHLH